MRAAEVGRCFGGMSPDINVLETLFSGATVSSGCAKGRLKGITAESVRDGNVVKKIRLVAPLDGWLAGAGWGRFFRHLCP